MSETAFGLKSRPRREQECCEAAEAAIEAMCETPPTTVADGRALLLHFVSEHERGCPFNEEQWVALAKNVAAGLAAIEARGLYEPA